VIDEVIFRQDLQDYQDEQDYLVNHANPVNPVKLTSRNHTPGNFSCNGGATETRSRPEFFETYNAPSLAE
jgi:hypothetical protein